VRNSAGLLRAARTPVATVLRNLLANAVKHHDLAAGNVVVEVSRDGRFYVIVLTDDGPGIAAEDQGRIFKLFQTLAPVQGEHTGGIGLAVVKKWVEASGGSVQVASPVEAGRGSRFTVRWPVNGEQVATTSHQG
jgi:signal transduction histidine kinase